MIRRVAGIAAGLVLLATAGWGITIRLDNPTYGAYSTGFSSSGQLLTVDATPDGNWTFYSGSALGALSNPVNNVGAFVFTANKQPLNNGVWAANTASSVWISPTAARVQGGHLATVPATSYIAVLDFQIPGPSQLPSGWTQWLLVMSGQVWADNTVAGNEFYLLTGSNTVAKTVPITGTPSPTSSGSFAFTAWVDPGATYKLAFILPNTANTWSGFRLEFTNAYVTPEPGAWALMLSAGAGLAFLSWRRRRAKKPQS